MSENTTTMLYGQYAIPSTENNTQPKELRQADAFFSGAETANGVSRHGAENNLNIGAEDRLNPDMWSEGLGDTVENGYEDYSSVREAENIARNAVENAQPVEKDSRQQTEEAIAVTPESALPEYLAIHSKFLVQKRREEANKAKYTLAA